MSSLDCKDVEIRFGYSPLLVHIHLTLYPSQKISLIGANGCGKTSLLRILAGLSKPYSGQVFCMGEQIWPTQHVSREHFCLFLGSQPALLLDHNLIWNLDYYCRCYAKRKNKADYINALQKFGLKDKTNTPVRLLSTGQKRRLTFAAIELIQPKIILADEPTNGLDAEGLELCFQVFNELCSHHQSAILVATHDKNLIEWSDSKMNLEQFRPTEIKQKQKINVLI